MTLLEMRDWSGYVMTVVSLLIALAPLLRRPRSRTIDRGWSVKAGRWFEVTRHHHETDVQS